MDIVSPALQRATREQMGAVEAACVTWLPTGTRGHMLRLSTLICSSVHFCSFRKRAGKQIELDIERELVYGLLAETVIVEAEVEEVHVEKKEMTAEMSSRPAAWVLPVGVAPNLGTQSLIPHGYVLTGVTACHGQT